MGEVKDMPLCHASLSWHQPAKNTYYRQDPNFRQRSLDRATVSEEATHGLFSNEKKGACKKAHDSSAALPILRTQKLSNPEQQRGRGEEDEVPPRAAPGGV